MLLRSTMTIGLLATLTACGGGGSSDSDSSTPPEVPFTSFSDIPADGVTVISGQAVTASYTADSAGNITSISPVSGPNPSDLRLTTQNNQGVAVSISAPGSSVSFDTRLGDTADGDVSEPVVFFETADGEDALLGINEANQGYEYQTYGAWVTGYDTGSGTVGAGSYGAKTNASNIPPVGTTADYSGIGLGIARRADGQPYATISNVNVTTDFNSATISSTGTEAVNLNSGSTGAASELDFAGSGSVVGSGFVAPVSGTGTSGSAQGQFYGPNANEVGGTFATTGSGDVSHIGSFGGN